MLKLQSSRPLKLISSLGLALSIALLGACSSSDPTKVEADFQINSVKGTVSGQNVTIDLTAKEACTDLTNLVADVEAYGASVSPDPKVARDYSQPVKFTVTAPDGTQVIYTVTVKGNTCGAPTSTTDPIPTTKTCPAHSYGTSGYELVFKACDTTTGNNTYYEKTECVRDNSTGLIWQGQTGPGTGLRGNDMRFHNFDSTMAPQKWNGSSWVAPTQADIDAVTNTNGFKNAVNATKLCGTTAWRIPAIEELACLIKIGNTPTIDLDWFPNTAIEQSVYWSSTPFSYLPQAYVPLIVETRVWSVEFSSGISFGNTRDMFRQEAYTRARLVHGTPSQTCEIPLID